jgi:hypothetical protein
MDTFIQQHVIALQQQFTDLAQRCPTLVLEYQLTPESEINLWVMRGGDPEHDSRHLDDLISRGSLLLGQLSLSNLRIRMVPYHPECQCERTPWISLVLAAHSFYSGTICAPADKEIAVDVSEIMRQKPQIKSTAPVRIIIKRPGYLYGALDNFVLASQTAAGYLLKRLLQAKADGISIEHQSGSPKDAELSVDVYANTVTVSRETYNIEPHHAQMLNALVEAAESGDWWVTGPQMQDLPGCHGKQISREIRKLKKQVPPLEQFITSQAPKGYRLTTL